MLDKISPAQFRFIYRKITWDQSKAPTSEQEKHDERIRCIIKDADKILARDLRINNGKKTKFDKFGILQKMLMKNWLPLTIDVMRTVQRHQGKL